MDVAIVRLEETEREAVVKEWKVVVHTTTGCKCRSPHPGIVVLEGVVRVRTNQLSATGEAVGEQREVLHGSPEDGAGRRGIQSVVLAIRMGYKDDFAAEVLIEVVGAASNRSKINRAVVDAQRLQLPVRAEVGVPSEEVEA
jgi:hypothetical protein